MNDQPPPNIPRVLIDGQIDMPSGHQIQVLAQPSTRRLIVLNSTIVNQLEIGQPLTLHLPDLPSQAVVVEALDRLSLIVRYTPTEPPEEPLSV
ncbi:MAG: hypothetical protein H0X37_15220 [Herpetosiphonaceae bacterium]|nr:hypothetical protein [Herpetosiphonaceae bacterium]